MLKRLSYIEGHLGGIRKMIEADQYCVDIDVRIVQFRYDPDQVSLDTIEAVLDDAGYPVAKKSMRGGENFLECTISDQPARAIQARRAGSCSW